jgi:hypothetical protein
MHTRRLVPELLDSIKASDPRAIRSRRDLRLINAFLGNERWIVRQLAAQRRLSEGVIELGAGEGHLTRRIFNSLPMTRATGLDLAPRPDNLPASVGWVQGDFSQTLLETEGDACIGNLILHHFDAAGLVSLGALLQRFRLLIFSEPLRAPLPLALAHLVLPLAGEVTRHDMPASIRSGFRKGELPLLLALDPSLWKWEEKESRRGSLRLIASRT